VALSPDRCAANAGKAGPTGRAAFVAVAEGLPRCAEIDAGPTGTNLTAAAGWTARVDRARPIVTELAGPAGARPAGATAAIGSAACPGAIGLALTHVVAVTLGTSFSGGTRTIAGAAAAIVIAAGSSGAAGSTSTRVIPSPAATTLTRISAGSIAGATAAVAITADRGAAAIGGTTAGG